MGVSIDASIYDIPSAAVHMQQFLYKHAEHRRPEATMDPKDFILTVGPDFGVILDDKFVMVYNEYYEWYNPASNFNQAVNMYYFGTTDLHSLMGTYDDCFPWLNGHTVKGGAEPLDRESALSLGLDYPEADLYDEDDD